MPPSGWLAGQQHRLEVGLVRTDRVLAERVARPGVGARCPTRIAVLAATAAGKTSRVAQRLGDRGLAAAAGNEEQQAAGAHAATMGDEDHALEKALLPPLGWSPFWWCEADGTPAGKTREEPTPRGRYPYCRGEHVRSRRTRSLAANRPRPADPSTDRPRAPSLPRSPTIRGSPPGFSLASETTRATTSSSRGWARPGRAEVRSRTERPDPGANEAASTA